MPWRRATPPRAAAPRRPRDRRGRRTGASAWRAWQDGNEPSRILEQFVVASWPDHLLQHARVTVRDKERYEAIRAMTDPAHPSVVTHWLTPQPRRAHRDGNPPVVPR
jgi:hypothetical protein